MRTLTAVLLVALTLPASAAIHLSAESAMSAPQLGPTDAIDAQIATNGETYVALWTDYRMLRNAIYAARFRRDGTLLDRVGVQIAPDGKAGAVIWSGQTFVIAYLQDDVVRVRTLAADGTLGAPLDLFGRTAVAESYKMRMATNGDSVLLVTSDPTSVLLDLDGRMRRQITMPWVSARPPGLGVAAAGPTYLVAVSTDLKVKTQIVTAAGDLGALQTLARGEPLGVDVASDGDRFLVTWARGHLQGVFVTQSGEPVPPVLALTSSSTTTPHPFARRVIGLVWRGSEYLLLYAENDPYKPFLTMRVSASGAPHGPLFTNYDGTIASIVTAPNGTGAVIGWRGNALTGAFLDPQAALLRDETRVALAARQQREVRLAALPAGIASAWIETDSEEGKTLHLSRGPGSAPVLVSDEISTLADVVFEGNTIWVLWTHEGALYTRRYTQALLAVDPAPVAVGTADSDRARFSVAAGGGTVMVVSDNVSGAYGYDLDVAAHVLRGRSDGIASNVIAVGTEAGVDHHPAVTWNGTAFVVAWASALGYTPTHRSVSTNDVYTGFHPDDRILTMRLDSLGRKLDAEPVEVARSKRVDMLAIAHGSRGTAVAWQPYLSPDRSSRRHTYAALATASATVVDLGGEDMYLASFAAHDGGFLLARATVSTETRITTPEVLELDAALGITDRVQLPSFATDIAYWPRAFDADVIGGPAASLAYARLAGGIFGDVSRHFVRRLADSPRRRPVRK